MQTTIIYITGIYDTLDLFTQELKNAFETMGYASFTYDARLEEESKQALIECIEEGTKRTEIFGVTFNNLGYNLTLPEAKTETGDACSKQNMGYSQRYKFLKRAEFVGNL